MEKALRSLIIEDSEDDALLLVYYLQTGGYEPEWRQVDKPEELEAALDEPWDIIFADYTMPRFSGTDALEIIRGRGIDTPFIFVSGTIGEDTAVAAMRAGAQDYIMKGSPKRLLPAVERELREAETRRRRRQAEGDLHMLQAILGAASDAADVNGALTATLEKICEGTGWPLAQAWVPRPDRAVVECSSAWCCRRPGLEKFREANLGFSFAPGEGLPGRVLASGKPLWLEDITSERKSPGALVARAAGLKTAFGVPVAVGNELLAILEFFPDEHQRDDRRLFELITGAVGQLGLVIQRKRAEERLHYLAHYDVLSGLPNRVLFTDRLKQALFEANRHDRLVGVAFIDLDRFKNINDSLGHEVGDMFLKAVAERLISGLRTGDTVARLAGDEFTIIMTDLRHADHAARVAQKILDGFVKPFHIAGHELYASISIGMTLCPPDNPSVEGLLRNADIAMYRAKDRGGNAYEFYSSDMASKVQARLALEKSLHQALQRGEFHLHYQPVVNLHTGQLIAVEALVRWHHPERGLIGPDEFIPLAEETGLVLPLGKWALRDACRQRRAWHGHGDGSWRITVNVSTRQFQQPDFLEMVTTTLEETGLDPRHLELEITETLLMQNPEGARSVMRALGALGVQFSVDDFGTGYSSLSYLKHLPISRVKIDKSFIDGVPADENDKAIIEAIISMARSLGLQVMAEGVATEEQCDFLHAHGCDVAQGYYFCRPLAPEDIQERLTGVFRPGAGNAAGQGHEAEDSDGKTARKALP